MILQQKKLRDISDAELPFAVIRNQKGYFFLLLFVYHKFTPKWISQEFLINETREKKKKKSQDKCHAGLLNLKGCLFPLRSQIDQNNFFISIKESNQRFDYFP